MFGIVVQFDRRSRSFTATAAYQVGGGKERHRSETGDTAQAALKRLLSRLRANGHAGKPYRALVESTGAILGGVVPRPRRRKERPPEASTLAVWPEEARPA